MSTLLERLADGLRRAAHFNRGVQAAPAVILWTDADRQWETVVPLLRSEKLTIFSLGPVRS
jgi:hypothetical protein